MLLVVVLQVVISARVQSLLPGVLNECLFG